MIQGAEDVRFRDVEIEDEQKRDQKRFKRVLDERIAAAGQAQSSLSSSKYEDCRHIEGTSNPVERLFLVLPRGSCPTVESIWGQSH